MHHVRVVRPLSASVAVRVQDEPCCAHQDKLLLQSQRQHHLLGAQCGYGRPAGAARGHRRSPGARSEHARAVDGRVAAVQLGRGVLAGGRREDQRGLPADGTTSDKGACCCPPDARAVLCGSLLAALHACSACGGRYVLLVPLVPLGGVCCASPARKQAQWAARARTSTCQTRARCSTVAHEPRCTSSVGVTGAACCWCRSRRWLTWPGPCSGCLRLAAVGRTNSLPIAFGRLLWHWGGMLTKYVQYRT